MNGGLIYTSTPSIGQLVSAFARTCAAQPSLRRSKQLDSQITFDWELNYGESLFILCFHLVCHLVLLDYFTLLRGFRSTWQINLHGFLFIHHRVPIFVLTHFNP